jgi:hypothetical protein
MLTLHKYPRTLHLAGSRLQVGDEGLGDVPLRTLADRHVVVEEKVDGANAGLGFDDKGQLWLQSRGHFLTGGVREKHFAPFKAWAHAHAVAFRTVLGDRYTLFGEWLYAKHTVFYDRLSHYFLEFDVLERSTGAFLSTARRRALLHGLSLVSVPVLHEGRLGRPESLPDLVGPSAFKSPNWREWLLEAAAAAGVDAEHVRRETDDSDRMEGLYVKVEEDGRVVERYKFVRGDFLNSILDSGTHWLRRPIVPNCLAEGVDLYGGGT